MDRAPAGRRPFVLLQVRGAALYARRKWVQEHHGQEALDALIPELGPYGRMLMRSAIDKHAWYNYPLFIELGEVLDRRYGTGDLSLNIELGKWGAKLNTPNIFRMFIKLGSPEWIMNKAAKLWREHFTEGTMTVEHTKTDSGGVAEAEITDWPVPHLALSYAVLGFAIAAIEMSGAHDVRGELISCRSLGGDSTRIRIRYEE